MKFILLLLLPLFASAVLTKDELKGAVGVCIKGACPSGFSCKENVCISSISSSTCAKPVGGRSRTRWNIDYLLSACISGRCPPGSSRQNGQCCKRDISLSACMMGQCPPNYTCKGEKCYPQ
ncbi:hypothetical protein PENTCL1PPCAC_2595 [Pristionchus entomophagus]|uniref:CC domain-containing protein n=1 Tax=Pristionchus entomophagus TaxID=358040 RepID=A0AAV5SC18_9BILA|nr:hypothetical protein PENTCL1PPCAC_2595 [Pristionchus entomophagus]